MGRGESKIVFTLPLAAMMLSGQRIQTKKKVQNLYCKTSCWLSHHILNKLVHFVNGNFAYLSSQWSERSAALLTGFELLVVCPLSFR